MSAIKPGDVVTLKSGGPTMTAGAHPTEEVYDQAYRGSYKRPNLTELICVWFIPKGDGTWVKQVETLPVAGLVPVSPTPSPTSFPSYKSLPCSGATDRAPADRV